MGTLAWKLWLLDLRFGTSALASLVWDLRLGELAGREPGGPADRRRGNRPGRIALPAL